MMNDDILSLIKDIVVVVIIYLVYFTVVKKRIEKASYNSKAARAIREGKCVTANFINKTCNFEGYDEDRYPHEQYYWTATYEYLVDGRNYKKNCHSYSEFAEQQIKVYYFPDNPQKAYSEVEAKSSGKELAGCLRTIILKLPLIYLVYKILLFYIKSM